jgi:penicillin-binding protein 1A
VTGGGLPAEIWHEVMTRVNEGVDASPLLTEIPDSTYVPIDPSTTEGAITAEEVPYFDGSNAPVYDGGSAGQQPDLAEQIIEEVLGTAGN